MQFWQPHMSPIIGESLSVIIREKIYKGLYLVDVGDIQCYYHTCPAALRTKTEPLGIFGVAGPVVMR